MNTFISILVFGSLVCIGVALPFVCKSAIEKSNFKIPLIVLVTFAVIFIVGLVSDIAIYDEKYTLDLIFAMLFMMFSGSLITSIGLLIFNAVKKKNVKAISIVTGSSLLLVIISFALVGSGVGVDDSSGTKANLVSETTNSSESESESSYSEPSSSSSSSSSESSVKNYEAVSYDNLARNPDDYKMKSVTVSGQVMQVQKEGKGYMLLVWQNDDSDQLVMVSVMKSFKPDNGNILEDDEITIQGYAYGTQEYDTTGGSTNEVPLIYADQKVVDNGKSQNAY